MPCSSLEGELGTDKKRATQLPPTLHKLQPLTAIKFQRSHFNVDRLDAVQVEAEHYQSERRDDREIEQLYIPEESEHP